MRDDLLIATEKLTLSTVVESPKNTDIFKDWVDIVVDVVVVGRDDVDNDDDDDDDVDGGAGVGSGTLMLFGVLSGWRVDVVGVGPVKISGVGPSSVDNAVFPVIPIYFSVVSIILQKQNGKTVY
jgi:hypothetical protein